MTLQLCNRTFDCNLTQEPQSDPAFDLSGLIARSLTSSVETTKLRQRASSRGRGQKEEIRNSNPLSCCHTPPSCAEETG